MFIQASPKRFDSERTHQAVRSQRPVSISRLTRYWAIPLVVVVGLCQTVGCRISKWEVTEAIAVSFRDMVWAKRAYNLQYGNCARPYGDDFKEGFCAGYNDVCNGGDGYVPALPPVEYRGVQYQSAEGVKCVNAWFEGYSKGVASARKDNVASYHNVLISKMINAAVAQDNDEKGGQNVAVKEASESKSSEAPPAPPAPETPEKVSATSPVSHAGRSNASRRVAASSEPRPSVEKSVEKGEHASPTPPTHRVSLVPISVPSTEGSAKASHDEALPLPTAFVPAIVPGSGQPPFSHENGPTSNALPIQQ